MTTTEHESRTRRVRVTYEPLPGHKPWRAVIVNRAEPAPGTVGTGATSEIPVGRFDSQPEAVTTACSALRFVAAGITWQPVGGEQS